jgi:hypothetical protein
MFDILLLPDLIGPSDQPSYKPVLPLGKERCMKERRKWVISGIWKEMSSELAALAESQGSEKRGPAGNPATPGRGHPKWTGHSSTGRNAPRISSALPGAPRAT